ncbi:hypothetical protein Goshw_024270 [Gossypium schwendimanii]|uniref:Reverse transcriptase zinc-binding domain-containing protein n=1 Tax=Gossypium schwendimanii TaxID=34291 RepID=A0A7J9N9K4_GOSSC|nr:hypothetical protein [Gossypium schwendimanii]
MEGLKWNLDLFLIWLPDEVINRTVSVPPPHPDSGIGYISSCPICGHGFEDIVHVFRDCLTAKEVWLHVIPSEQHQRFFSDTLQNWLSANLFCHLRLQDGGNVTWSAVEVVKVFFSWVQQFKFHQSGYKIDKHNPIHNFQDNSLWVQLYIDGAVVRDTRNAFVGGMLRDQCRNWILGFNRYLGYRWATIQIDNLDVVQTLNDIGLEGLGITLLRRLR